MHKARIAALAAGARCARGSRHRGCPRRHVRFRRCHRPRRAPAASPAGISPWLKIEPGVVRLAVTDRLGPFTTAQCEKSIGIACYEPDQIRAAYNVAPLYKQGITGKGATIVIVDSFGSPTIQNDLSVFDKQFGYPDPPSFKIITPAGPGHDRATDMTGWAGETTLDVEYAHTLAPGANILLVETPDAETEGVTGFPNIVKAEQYVIDHHLGRRDQPVLRRDRGDLHQLRAARPAARRLPRRVRARRHRARGHR